MSEIMHVGRWRGLAGVGLGVGLMLGTATAPVAAGVAKPSELPSCGYRPALVAAGGDTAWSVRLDQSGAVSGHELRIEGAETRLRFGRRAFATLARDGHVLVGERARGHTRLSMIDGAWACRLWDRRVEGLAFPLVDGSGQDRLAIRLVEPTTRASEGAMLLDLETGASSAMIDGLCPGDCEGDDEIAAAELLPAGADRPVPRFAGGAWPTGKRLLFRWPSGAVPPDWAKVAIKAAAAEATASSMARSLRFAFDRVRARNGVRYTGAFPSFCRQGIGCAQRVLLSAWWSTWLRPNGTEFSWGTLRWCQKKAHSTCFG